MMANDAIRTLRLTLGRNHSVRLVTCSILKNLIFFALQAAFNFLNKQLLDAPFLA